MKSFIDLNVKIFADGADKRSMYDMYSRSYIKGLTTNPTLMRAAGVKDYKAFCREVLSDLKDKPISFEVLSDDLSEIERQAFEIASWGNNVYVKVPVTNTSRESTGPLVNRLTQKGVKVNVTALMTLEQVKAVVQNLSPTVPAYISVFAGRIADTGRDPLPLIQKSVREMQSLPLAELIWASPRELLNIFQAEQVGCHIITVTNDILKKESFLGYDLDDFSLDTVKMFYRDALEAGFSI